MRISDWSSDVCSSDLITGGLGTNALVSLDSGEGDLVGVATEDIPNNSNGRVTTFGTVNDINTSAFIDGDVLYSSATGTLTTALTASFVGVVLNASPSIGRILVKIGRASCRESGCQYVKISVVAVSL